MWKLTLRRREWQLPEVVLRKTCTVHDYCCTRKRLKCKWPFVAFQLPPKIVINEKKAWSCPLYKLVVSLLHSWKAKGNNDGTTVCEGKEMVCEDLCPKLVVCRWHDVKPFQNKYFRNDLYNITLKADFVSDPPSWENSCFTTAGFNHTPRCKIDRTVTVGKVRGSRNQS